jgi:hypothetical protein
VSRPCVRIALLGAALSLLSACVPEGLAFVKDDRLEITSPASRADVKPPVTISWKVRDFEVTGETGSGDDGAGYFAVFVDKAPVPPGRSLAWLARDDTHCLATRGCPNETYLADRGVYSTSETTLTLKRLPDLNAYQGHENHEVTVVLLDGTGHRIGESAWYVNFLYDRPV